MIVRPAARTDAVGMGEVHYASWIETYGPLLPEGFWDSRSSEDRVALWTRLLTDASANERLAVAEHNGTIVGIAMSAPPRVGAHGAALPARDVELSTLYLLARHHGSGAGQLLIDSVLTPTEPAQLWVAERNPRAVAFYQRNGFRPDGHRSHNERFAGLTELRMVRAG